MHFHGIFRDEVFGEVLGAVSGTVLAAGAAETDLQVRETALEEPVHVRIDQGIDMVQEAEDLTVLLQELSDRFIQACQLLEPLIFPWIMHAPAVEHIPSSISGRILRNAFLEGETVDSYGQGDPEEGVLFPKPVPTLGHIRGRGPPLAVGGTEQSPIAEGLGNNTPSGERAPLQSSVKTWER